MKKHIYSVMSFLSLNVSLSSLLAGVNVEKYRAANPDPLDAIPEGTKPEFEYDYKWYAGIPTMNIPDRTIKTPHSIAHGSYGYIYPVTIPGIGDNGQQFIVKEGDLGDEEIEIGQYIRDTRHNITPQTQLADTQGLELVVPTRRLEEKEKIEDSDETYFITKSEFFVQERVQGKSLLHFATSRFNGWIDSPKKAVERLCALLSSLYALEKAGIVHNDLHTNNIMIEEKKLPDEVITAKVEAKARQMTGITEEEKDLTEENKKTFNDAKITARANLTTEDQYEYVPRIIDFGLAKKVDSDNKRALSDNMKSLGMRLLPALIFGKKGSDHFLQEGKNFGLPELRKYISLLLIKFKNIVRAEIEEELIEEKKNSGQEKDQLGTEIISLKNNLGRLNEELKDLYGKSAYTQRDVENKQQKINELEIQINSLEKEIVSKKATYRKEYHNEWDSYKWSFENDLNERIAKVDLEARTDAVKNQYVIEKFHEINAAMQEAIKKSYPEPVLKELAQFTANCLSDDLEQIPTAEEAYQKITDLFLFSDWSSEQ